MRVQRTTLSPPHTLTPPAIIEYLEETRPEPALLPTDALSRARVREVCCVIGNDIQPVGNLRVLNRLASVVSAATAGDGAAAAGGAAKGEWSRHYIGKGFAGLEALLARPGYAGAYCVGDTPTMADAFLAPQVYNALRWKVSVCVLRAVSSVCPLMRARLGALAADASHAPPHRRPLLQVDMAPFPTIARVYAALVALPEFAEAQPSAQPDAEKE